MTEIIKETVTNQGNNTDPVVRVPAVTKATDSQTIEYLIYFFFGLLDVLLFFRLILKIAGANLGSGFVGAVYGLTGLFILPFENIFRRSVVTGSPTALVFEPSTIVAIIVYTILGWGIVKLVRISTGEKQES